MRDWVDRRPYPALNLQEGPYLVSRGLTSGSPRGGIERWPTYHISSICSDSNTPSPCFKQRGQGQVLTGASLHFQKGENSLTRMSLDVPV